MKNFYRVALAITLGAAAVLGDWFYAGQWGSNGAGNGEFNWPFGVAVAPGGDVYVADSGNNRIQYFTDAGSYLGRWGSVGSGNGQLIDPRGLCFNVPGSRVYVVDRGNNRIQYFNRNEPSVEPSSLGRVKTLFK